MKVLICHSGHYWSTLDVARGLIAGLKANDIKVAEYPLHDALGLAHRLIGYAEDAGENLPDQLAFDMAAGGLAGAALYVEADVVIAITGRNVPWRVIEAIRKGGIQTALLCTESPYTTTQFERHDAAVYDYVFTNERTAVPLFDRNPRSRVQYLPHAYNPDVHTPEGEAIPSDVLFIGTGFQERQDLFAGLPITLLGPLWEGDESRAASIENTEAAARYRGAAICLNHHRTTADWRAGTHITEPAESLGPRAYEIAACGSFQLCDDSRPELREVFGENVPTYHDAGDLARQIAYYQKRPDERARRAAAAREAVAPHTWAARAAQMLSVVAERPRLIRLAS
jgi:spore maturation protein CgeB